MTSIAIPTEIDSAIQSAMRSVEKECDVRILLAVESGSRAWGFASPDSDWDVRFVYVHRPEWYLSIDDERDVIERMLPMDIDLAGWELRKTLRLFRKSNPPLLEWLRSPLLYKESYSFASSLRALSSDFFSPISVTYHYLSMARRNHAQYLMGEVVRLKKYLYVLRPLLACEWVRLTGIMAPMEFQRKLDMLLPEGDVRQAVDRLLINKMSGGELGTGPKDPILHQWIEDRLAYYDEHPPVQKIPSATDTSRLDALFRSTLQEVWTS
jgi:predicted nucleotidyltransferase